MHRSAIVIDTHCDTLGSILRGQRRFFVRNRSGHVDLPRLRVGGVTAQLFAAGLHAFGARSETPTRLFLQMADTLHRLAVARPSEFMLATSASDITEAKRRNRVAGILSMEDAEPVDGDLALLRMFHRIGLRVVGLCWGPANGIGEGVSHGGDRGNGLTSFGKALIRETKSLGMVVDVAHLNAPGFWDVMRITEEPVIASHANAQGRCRHSRNLSDDQIRALAERGGTIHVTFTFLRDDGQRPRLDDLLDHIEYIVDLVGPTHVGLGSDYDGLLSPPPVGLLDASRFANITEGLLQRGYDADAVLGILGGNFLRVFKHVVGN